MGNIIENKIGLYLGNEPFMQRDFSNTQISHHCPKPGRPLCWRGWRLPETQGFLQGLKGFCRYWVRMHFLEIYLGGFLKLWVFITVHKRWGVFSPGRKKPTLQFHRLQGIPWFTYAFFCFSDSLWLVGLCAKCVWVMPPIGCLEDMWVHSVVCWGGQVWIKGDQPAELGIGQSIRNPLPP